MNAAGSEAPDLGELVGRIDVPRGRTARLEVRIKQPDSEHRFGLLLIVRHTTDGRHFTLPVFSAHVNELLALLVQGARMIEESEARR